MAVFERVQNQEGQPNCSPGADQQCRHGPAQVRENVATEFGRPRTVPVVKEVSRAAMVATIPPRDGQDVAILPVNGVNATDLADRSTGLQRDGPPPE